MSRSTLSRMVDDQKYVTLVAKIPFGDDENYRHAYDLYNNLNEFWYNKVDLSKERDSLCGASFYECWTSGEYRVSIQMLSRENYERLKAEFPTKQQAWMSKLDTPSSADSPA